MFQVQFPGVQSRLDTIYNAATNEEESGEQTQQAGVATQNKRIPPVNEEVKEKTVQIVKDPGEDDVDATVVKHEEKMVCRYAQLVEKCLNEHECKIQVVSCERWKAQHASITVISAVSQG